MLYYSFLHMLFVTQLPLTQHPLIDFASPAEWPVSVTYSVAVSAMSGMVDLSLQVSNNADSPIVALVFDKVKSDDFNGSTAGTGEYGLFFVELVSDDQERSPIDPRTTRTVSDLFPGPSSGVRLTLHLKSVLFANGTSLGQREPYAYRYIDQVLERRIKAGREALANAQAPEEVQLLEGLIATFRQRAVAFSAVSSGSIENRVRGLP